MPTHDSNSQYITATWGSLNIHIQFSPIGVSMDPRVEPKVVFTIPARVPCSTVVNNYADAISGSRPTAQEVNVHGTLLKS